MSCLRQEQFWQESDLEYAVNKMSLPIKQGSWKTINHKDLEVQMLVCVSVCPSHLLQLYWTSEEPLKDLKSTLDFIVYKIY